MNCPKCDSVNDESRKVCRICGAPINGGPGILPAVKKNKQSKGLGTLALFLGIVSFVLWSNLVMIGIIAALAGLICGICARGSARAIVGIILSSINLAFVILALIISFIQIAVK